MFFTEDQLMRILLDNFQKGGKCTAQIASHQAELRRGRKNTDQKYLSITFLQTDYLNIDRSSGSSRNNKREILLKNALFV